VLIVAKIKRKEKETRTKNKNQRQRIETREFKSKEQEAMMRNILDACYAIKPAAQLKEER
jgi:hypothetical protein